jgi:RNA polymerase sigma factor (sigma-70 family)
MARVQQLSGVIQHLRRTVLRDGVALTDGQLLTDYISRHDGAALAALVQRHAPMVWGVCRRVLGNHHDAEDAFQATFLVLVRRAASLASPELLANWLYGVAHQTALKARATAARRKQREKQVTEMPEPVANQQEKWHELRPLLDEELSRLPGKYRGIIVLCDLEGKTRKAAARQLGCAEGTVASRLARARVMLAKRLTRRGLACSGGALAAVLSDQAVSAAVPNTVVNFTINTASLLAAGSATATRLVSVKAVALAEGVMKTMMFTKLKTATAVVLILGFVVTGATILTCRTAAGQDDRKPAVEKPAQPVAPQEKDKDKDKDNDKDKDKDKEIATAWGDTVGGLQAGLSFRPGVNRVYHHGETITLIVRIRNVGKETVKFEYIRQFLDERPPTVTDADGKTILQSGISVLGVMHVPVEVSLAPGKEIALESRIHGTTGLPFEFWQAGGTGQKHKAEERPLFVGTGKVTFQYERVLGNSSISSMKLDPALSKLATGKLELEIKAAATEKK